jgi:hypothetical protein
MGFSGQRARRLLPVLLLWTPGLLCAQGAADTVAAGPAPESVQVGRIVITGNRITKPAIILRELLFREGDTLPRPVLEAALRRSRENLLNTSLFNFVDMALQPDAGQPGVEHVIVHVAERWYLWPLPVF